MIKITMWLNENKKVPEDQRTVFRSEEFTGDKIYETAIELSDELKDFKVRMEKITKGGKIESQKQYVKGKI